MSTRARPTGCRPPLALYLQGEIYRLRGESDQAEAAYRQASELGLEPQPGLALLRLTQGRTKAACTAIRRLTNATRDRIRLAALLPAFVEIMLANKLDVSSRTAATAYAYDHKLL